MIICFTHASGYFGNGGDGRLVKGVSNLVRTIDSFQENVLGPASSLEQAKYATLFSAAKPHKMGPYAADSLAKLPALDAAELLFRSTRREVLLVALRLPSPSPHELE